MNSVLFSSLFTLLFFSQSSWVSAEDKINILPIQTSSDDTLTNETLTLAITANREAISQMRNSLQETQNQHDDEQINSLKDKIEDTTQVAEGLLQEVEQQMAASERYDEYLKELKERAKENLFDLKVLSVTAAELKARFGLSEHLSNQAMEEVVSAVEENIEGTVLGQYIDQKVEKKREELEEAREKDLKRLVAQATENICADSTARKCIDAAAINTGLPARIETRLPLESEPEIQGQGR